MKIKRLGNYMFVAAKRDIHRTAVRNGARVGFYKTPGYVRPMLSGYVRPMLSGYVKVGAYLLQVYPATLDIRR